MAFEEGIPLITDLPDGARNFSALRNKKSDSDDWSTRFDEPILLDDGTTLRTLRDAIRYLGKTVPKAEREHPAVTVAADHLTRSAEQGYLRSTGDLAQGVRFTPDTRHPQHLLICPLRASSGRSALFDQLVRAKQ
jgi:hypothetical protein